MALVSPLRSLLERPESERRLGPFQLVRQLGRGGFAPVWLAREVYGDLEIRRAAVKLFSLDDPAVGGGATEARLRRERVMEEARLLGRVEHPNIVRYYTTLADEERGVVGLVMEYVEGSSLEDGLATQGKLPIDDVLKVGAAVASALSAVHRAGLVHRDVKPANVIEAGDVIKLIDFGIASADRLRPEVTQRSRSRRIVLADLPAEVLGSKVSMLSQYVTHADGTKPESSGALPSGTAGYIDPACVAERAPATPASDLYALGATLFECITGKLPSVIAAGPQGGMRGDVLDGRVDAPRLADNAPDAPAGLARLVDALLSPERSKRPASAERVAVELERLRGERVGRARELPPEQIGPFRSLGRFELTDRDVYFGRSAEVAAVIEMLRSRGLVALVGASGSGKSSLAVAGIAPVVRDSGLGGWIKGWDVMLATPGARAQTAIGAALADLVPNAATLEPDAIVAALAARAEMEGRGVLLVVDQLEELVTLAAGEGREWVAALLARIADPMTPGVRALVAARRDLLDPLLALGDLKRVLPRSLYVIEPMTEASWSDVIDQALGSYGYAFEDVALRDELMAELKDTAASMPLVQFALTELWEQRDRVNKKVTRAGLHAIGGIGGALERHAEAILVKLSAADPTAIDTVREALLEMTTPQGTRSIRKETDLGGATAGSGVVAVLAQLEAARLLVRHEGGLTLAHEALLTQWGRLRDWLAAAREDRLLAEELGRDAARWKREQDPSLLWKKRRLAAAEDLVRVGRVRLSAEAKEFVRRGRSSEQRGAVISAIVAALILALAVAGVVKYVRDTNAEKEKADRALADSKESEKRAQQNETLARDNEKEAKGQKKLADKKTIEADELKRKFERDLDDLTAALTAAETDQQLRAVRERVNQKRPAGSAAPTSRTPPPSASAVGDPFDP